MNKKKGGTRHGEHPPFLFLSRVLSRFVRLLLGRRHGEGDGLRILYLRSYRDQSLNLRLVVQRFFEHSDSFSDYLLDSVAHDLVDDAATLEHDVLGHVCGIQ